MRKRLLLLLLFALFLPQTHYCWAQFIVSPDGIKTEDGKDFLVITADNMSKQELYQAVLKHTTKTYVSPKDVISNVEGEVITINGLFTINDVVDYNVNYTLRMEFRDGRMKYSVPHINYMKGYFQGKEYELTYNVSNGGFGSVCLVGIYNKKGELKRKKAKSQLERFFNDGVSSLKQALITKEEDW